MIRFEDPDRIFAYEGAMKAVLDAEDVSRMYPAMYAGLKSGLLMEVDGLIGLAEWTSPGK